MGKELAPRTFDQRISLADAKRRCKKQLRDGGGDLKAVIRTQYPKAGGKAPYKVVMTGLIVDGILDSYYSYRSNGKVLAGSSDLHEFAVTEEFPAYCEEEEKALVDGSYIPFGDISRNRLGLESRVGVHLLQMTWARDVRWTGHMEQSYAIRIHKDDIETFVTKATEWMKSQNMR